jgi:hypothetical protein
MVWSRAEDALFSSSLKVVNCHLFLEDRFFLRVYRDASNLQLVTPPETHNTAPDTRYH